MRATAEPVEGNKVRLTVQIDEPEVDEELDRRVRDLSRRARVPGFRPGKVPRKVLEARMGGALALRSEVLREVLPDFYARAVSDAEVDPIAAPDIDLTTGEEQGAVAFDAVVEVRPTVGIGGYGGLRVTVPSPSVTEADVDSQIDRLRENEAELVVVGRPAIAGDNLTVDVHAKRPSGEEVLGADDYLLEIGKGALGPEVDAQLLGAKVGDVLAFDAAPPGSEEKLSFRVLVKEVKDKNLPEVTDEWASETSEFSTLSELRADLRQRVGQLKRLTTQMALRERALQALVELVDEDEVPEVLVEDELRQRVEELNRRLAEQRASLEQYLAAVGKSPDELVAEVRTEAHQAVKADLALRALASAEQLDVTDQELSEELSTLSQRLEMDEARLRQQLERSGRLGAVRSEQRKSKAMTWLADHVDVVDEEGNAVSRDELRAEGERSEKEAPDQGSPADDPEAAEVQADETVAQQPPQKRAQASRSPGGATKTTAKDTSTGAKTGARATSKKTTPSKKSTPNKKTTPSKQARSRTKPT